MSEQDSISRQLTRLGLSDSEIHLYLALTTHGALTAQELVKITSSKRPTVYYALRQLIHRGLVHRGGVPGIERFQSESPDKLITMIQFKRAELDELEKEIGTIIPILKQNNGHIHEGIPAVSFYEGDAAVKQAVLETIYCQSGHIDSIAPSDNFFWQIGQSFSQKYIDERVAHEITTRNLWEQPLEPKILLKSYTGFSTVRILPKSMHGKFRTTVFLYDDKVMYIASRKSGYALVVKSKEHYELMKAMYEALWQSSKEVAVSGKE